MEIKWIRDQIRQARFLVSFTHTEKLRRRRIEIEAIKEAVAGGGIIESYPEDARGPSCLMLGWSQTGRPIHVVCGKTQDDWLLIITAYEPDPDEWERDWKKRKGRAEP